MRKLPKVSVILPAYNAENFLRRAVESLFRQSYGNMEILLVDDASTDATWAIIEQLRRESPVPLIAVRLETNQGPMQARNTALAKATGELIAYQDADDESEYRRFENQVDFLRKNPWAAMVYTDYREVADTRMRIQRAGAFSYKRLLLRNYIACGSVMHHYEVYAKTGPWDRNDDWGYWLRVADNFKIGYLDRPLYRYHLDMDGFSAQCGVVRNLRMDARTFKETYQRTKAFMPLFKWFYLSLLLFPMVRLENHPQAVIFINRTRRLFEAIVYRVLFKNDSQKWR